MIQITKKQFIIIISIILIIVISIGTYLLYQNSFSDFDYSDLEEGQNILENETSTSPNDISSDSSNLQPSSSSNELIIVHITGHVNSPGIVKLPDGSRVSDAIDSAGGTTAEADLSPINLAYRLEDGQKVYIPSLQEVKERKQETTSSEDYISQDSGDSVILEENSYSKEGNQQSQDKININSATQTQLELIPGVGPSTALKIIEYRNTNGKFESIEDIKSVKGIGDTKFENMKEYICIK